MVSYVDVLAFYIKSEYPKYLQMFPAGTFLPETMVTEHLVLLVASAAGGTVGRWRLGGLVPGSAGGTAGCWRLGRLVSGSAGGSTGRSRWRLHFLTPSKQV